MISLKFRTSHRPSPRFFSEPLRNEQAFYDRYADASRWKPTFLRFAVVPVGLALSTALVALLPLFH
jgi:hypothetical protein